MASGLDYTTFSDPIHGQLSFHTLLKKIIDTEEFQRLQKIKQLGTVHYIYRSANCTRFEHSLGVAHLAGALVKKIREKQPNIGITDRDIICVQIAGLCHDIGHGPFSHTHELFVNRMNPQAKFKHETMSIAIFDRLIERNGFEPDFQNVFGSEWKAWVRCVKEQIAGNGLTRTENKWPSGKDYLYEIISNEETGVDVDKWDYILRDAACTGVKTGFDHSRLLESCAVIEQMDEFTGKTKRVLGFRDKNEPNLYELFHAREQLNRLIYKHKTSMIVELMHLDALALADEHLHLEHQGSIYKMSTAHENLDVYLELNDGIVEIIKFLSTTDCSLLPAKDKFLAIDKRQLYKQVDRTNPIKPGSPVLNLTCAEVEEEIFKELDETMAINTIHKDVIVIQKISFDYGKKCRNPLEKQVLYTKENRGSPRKRKAEEVSSLLPRDFQCTQFRCISKSGSAEVDEKIREAFTAVFKRKQIETSIFTPCKNRPSRNGSVGGRQGDRESVKRALVKI